MLTISFNPSNFKAPKVSPKRKFMTMSERARAYVKNKIQKKKKINKTLDKSLINFVNKKSRRKYSKVKANSVVRIKRSCLKVGKHQKSNSLGSMNRDLTITKSKF